MATVGTADMIKEQHKPQCTGIDPRCMWRIVHAVMLQTGHSTKQCMALIHTFHIQQIFLEHFFCGRHGINVSRVCGT